MVGGFERHEHGSSSKGSNNRGEPRPRSSPRSRVGKEGSHRNWMRTLPRQNHISPVRAFFSGPFEPSPSHRRCGQHSVLSFSYIFSFFLFFLNDDRMLVMYCYLDLNLPSGFCFFNPLSSTCVFNSSMLLVPFLLFC